MGCQRPAGVEDVGKIGFAVLVEKGWNAEDHGLAFRDRREVGGGLKAATFLEPRHCFGGNVANVGFSFIEFHNLRRIDINAGHLQPGLGELNGQRQADVAKANNGQRLGGGLGVAWGDDASGFRLEQFLVERNCL